MAEAVLTPNVTSLISNVLEISATDLAAKSTVERAALYKQGIRALKVINNDTIVLLGLQEDGSTIWLGNNKPINNLLDNSNFLSPVNQRKAEDGDYSWKYAIDRWMFNGNGFSISSVGITIPSGGRIAQRMAAGKCIPDDGKTFCCGLSDGRVIAADSETHSDDNVVLYKLNSDNYSGVNITNGTSDAITIEWCALYEGSYTADTLPPYTPKQWEVELTNCQKYYRVLNITGTYQTAYTGILTDGNTVISVQLFDKGMRINPSVTISGDGGLLPRSIAGYLGSYTYGSPCLTSDVTLTAFQNGDALSVTVKKTDGSSWGGTNNTPTNLGFKAPVTIQLVADL